MIDEELIKLDKKSNICTRKKNNYLQGSKINMIMFYNFSLDITIGWYVNVCYGESIHFDKNN